MYSITENIYYSQLSSVAILLQPEPNCFTSYNTRKWLCFLSLFAVVFRSPPASHVSTCNGQRSSQLFCVHYISMTMCSVIGRVGTVQKLAVLPVSVFRAKWLHRNTRKLRRSVGLQELFQWDSHEEKLVTLYFRRNEMRHFKGRERQASTVRHSVF
jgi:hypothetical protein